MSDLRTLGRFNYAGEFEQKLYHSYQPLSEDTVRMFTLTNVRSSLKLAGKVGKRSGLVLGSAKERRWERRGSLTDHRLRRLNRDYLQVGRLV